MMHHRETILLQTLIVILTTKIHVVSSKHTILFIPLDERFTTRSIVLNLARLIDSDYSLLTPPIELISHWKQPANTTVLFQWLQNQIVSSCTQPESCSLLISAEQLLYGGLINSRLSNTSSDDLNQRLNTLVELKRTYDEQIKLYLSTVIMRIPSYNGDFEEPDYWATYGRLIYLWSFYTDRFNVLHNPADEQQVQQLEKQIPSNILEQFVWRRQRNYNLTYSILHDYTEIYFERIWLTLDDNAEYGLNIAESRKLIQLVNDTSLNISSKVNIYPGADEVSLTMLSQIVVNTKTQEKKPTFAVFYRNITTQNRIPNYEGAPLNESLLKQIAAAGGEYVNQSTADIVVLVNNWSTDQQQEASSQQTCEDYSPLNISTGNSTVVYADVRYSNGGDICFSEWILNRTDFGSYAYAGWNTNGNTLGTCLSNGILLKYYLTESKNNITLRENRRFTLYRFIEDVKYQADLRQILSFYLNNVSMDPTDELNVDADFYEKFIAKGFQVYAHRVDSEFHTEDVYYPWNRTFEIGFELADSY